MPKIKHSIETFPTSLFIYSVIKKKFFLRNYLEKKLYSGLSNESLLRRKKGLTHREERRRVSASGRFSAARAPGHPRRRRRPPRRTTGRIWRRSSWSRAGQRTVSRGWPPSRWEGWTEEKQKNGASCIDYDWLGPILVAAFYSRPSGGVPLIPSRIGRGLSPLEPPVTEASFATTAPSDAGDTVGVHAADR